MAVLYNHPLSHFNKCLPSEVHEINTPTLHEDRVALLVSSTSWTPDKDFNTLLEALKLYEEHAQALNDSSQSSLMEKLLKIWMVITGKGPLHFRGNDKTTEVEFESK
ncbi:hypothetical protein F5141DRAFT_1065488 [Pisolithus sp. B1]|nr:hypothetical protein F5141DRAFT_1065488 [Pisolithus sp. B1]